MTTDRRSAMKRPLFATAPRLRWTGTTALAIRLSPDCQCGPTLSGAYIQPALFYHGGYGAAEAVESMWCMCGRVRIRNTRPVNPRTL